MTKHIEIKPMVIPVINHAYGIDSEFDITERATTMFEEISYEIFRCSHGIVKYEQDSFVRVNWIPELADNGKANYKSLIHYLDWNRDISISDRVRKGYKGEFWLYGEWFEPFAIIRNGYINPAHTPSMGIPYDKKVTDILENFIWRIQHSMRPNDWPYEGDPRKWLSRLPEKYWGNIK